MTDLGLAGPHADLAWWTIAVGAVINTACALLGCYLTLRRMSLLGDAISHAVLPGIVAAFLFAGRSTTALFLGAMVVGMLTTFLVQILHRYGGVGEDTGMGVVFTSLFSIGVLMLTVFARDVHLDASCVLFGEIEYIPLDVVEWHGVAFPRVLPRMLAALVGVILFIVLLWKELKLAAFDPGLATAAGFHATLIHYLMMGMTAIVTVAAFEAVGSILSVAMLVVPPTTAFLLTQSLRAMLLCSATTAIAASFLGYVGAAALGANVAGMSAVAVGLLFAAAVVFAPNQGLLTRLWHHVRLSLQIVGEDLTALLFREQETAGAASQGLASAELVRRVGGGVAARWALRGLLRRGEVEVRGERIVLTDRGKSAAESLVRSHRLWEAYLVQNFQLPLDHLHEPAEKIEHFIGPGLQQQLAESLPKSDVDPHGREIPQPRE